MKSKENTKTKKNRAKQKREEDKQARKEERQSQKEEKRWQIREKRKRNKEIYISGLLLFLILGATLGYFCVFLVSGKQTVLVNSYNNRIKNMEQTIKRGTIKTSDGVDIAVTTVNDQGESVRVYPFSDLFCHTVGYSTMGTTGLERSQNVNLLTSKIGFFEQISNELMDRKSPGDTVITTFDYGLQQCCYNQLAGKTGAIVVVQPSTGKILAMVSSPGYDPNTIKENWNALVSGENNTGNLTNRAAQSSYPPGSTFKIITLLEYIRENPDTWQNFSYTCHGSLTVDGHTVKCHDGHEHGTVDIYGALEQSCNGAFITLGLSLNTAKWKTLSDSFGYNQKFDTEFSWRNSRTDISKDSTTWDVMQESIGQGTTLCTPLLNTMIFASVANGGKLMLPYMVDHVENVYGEVVKSYDPTVLSTPMTESESELLTEFLRRVVSQGSGGNSSSMYCQVAGKTGSAQYDTTSGNYHAWFAGFAPAEDPQIAFCVFLEEGGTGGDYAAPLAANICNYYFGR